MSCPWAAASSQRLRFFLRVCNGKSLHRVFIQSLNRFVNPLPRGDDHAFVAAESGPPNHFFILGIHFPGNAELDGAADGQ